MPYKLSCGHGEDDQAVRGGSLVCILCGVANQSMQSPLPELIQTGEAAQEITRQLIQVAEMIQARLIVADCEARQDDATVWRIALQTIRNMASRRGGKAIQAKAGAPRLRVVGGRR
jgi:hypothetical protein